VKIHLLYSRVTKHQLEEMLEALANYVKLAVDIQRGILAGGGVLHADCEALLLDEGSQQEDTGELIGSLPRKKCATKH
jgi:hypothetical protein